MGLEVVFNWADAGFVASGLFGVGALVWLLRASTPSPARNAFAVVLLVITLNLALYNLYWNGPGAGPWSWMAEIPDNLVALAIFYFLLTWLAAETGRPMPRWVPWSLLLVGVGVTLLWLLQPGWRYEILPDGSAAEHGGIFAVENAFEIAADIAVATVLMRSAIRRDSILPGLAALGFLWVVPFGGFRLPFLLQGKLGRGLALFSDGQRALDLLLDLALVAGALYMLGVTAYFWARAQRNRTRSVLVASILALTGLSFVFGWLYLASDHRGWVIAYRTLGGLLALALAIFGAMLFVVKSSVGRESRVWTASRRGALPALMLATFFVVSEVAQTFLAGSLGPIAGIVATAPLVLAIQPIQRLGDRFGHAIAPARSPGLAEKETIYEQQLRHAWGDGAIGAKERSRLVHLRKALGVSAERAEAIEETVVASPGKGAPPVG